MRNIGKPTLKRANMKNEQIKKKCISDFGQQWTHFRDNENYYGSKSVFKDICGPNFSLDIIQGCIAADIGAGTGRITNILCDLNAKKVYAVEPSDAFEVLKTNTQINSEKIIYVNEEGTVKLEEDVDLVFIIGVLHHIVEPVPVLKQMYKNLKSGGQIIIWVYGYEGNRLYLSLILPLRKITKNLSHQKLIAISKFLRKGLNLYNLISKKIKIPMSSYFANHIDKLDQEARLITIYDQLNPSYAKYYRKQEIYNLLKSTGFKDIQLYHRHGYSWTVTASK
jgi:SAM-dependent methyltransferase